MTTHPLILAELTKYRGGEFVPRHLSTMLLVYDTDLGWWAWRSETRGDQCDIEDAHAHIELAAWKMVRRHAVELDESVDIDDLTGDTNIYSACCTKDIYTLLGSGPTDADALLAALVTINAKENA